MSESVKRSARTRDKPTGPADVRPASGRRGDGPPPARPIPPSVELAWGLREEGTRGPRRGLTLQRIVDAGIEVAAAEGVGALSMAKIAKRLGVGRCRCIATSRPRTSC